MTSRSISLLMLWLAAAFGCKTTENSGLYDAATCPSAPSGTSCQYYDCLEKEYKCGTAGYPASYGDKYCRKFQSSCDGKLTTPDSKLWVRGTTKCLQQDIEDSRPTLKSCSAVSDHAFKSHAYCYTKGSAENGGKNFCSLGPLTWSTVLGCVDSNDRYSGDILRQMRRTATSCVGFFGAAFFLDDSANEILDEDAKDVVRGLSEAERAEWSQALNGLIGDIDQRLGAQAP